MVLKNNNCSKTTHRTHPCLTNKKPLLTGAIKPCFIWHPVIARLNNCTHFATCTDLFVVVWLPGGLVGCWLCAHVHMIVYALFVRVCVCECMSRLSKVISSKVMGLARAEGHAGCMCMCGWVFVCAHICILCSGTKWFLEQNKGCGRQPHAIKISKACGEEI